MIKKGLFITAIFILFAIASLAVSASLAAEGETPLDLKAEHKKVLEWRNERDNFLKNHERSPLTHEEKANFKGLKYYPFDPRYVFSGQIERYIIHINSPEYYATFLTNKGTNKRYLRYGKFQFKLDGKDYSIEIYKSILSDNLFIPFKDKTNGKETYAGGRYLETEIQLDYKTILDFNMAYYPSCAYNKNFICVIPPKENMLEGEIRAGERNFIK
jgi:uncharacterized protein (DUF1684 family)